MKVKFTKLAALLLAGAALLAAGCTDYEVDIQQANKRIDQLDKEKATVASLEEQGNALRAMISRLEKKHDDDVKDLQGDIDALDGALGKLRSDFDANVAAVAKEISDLKAADDNFTVQVTDLFTKYQNLYDTKADKTELAKVQSDLLEAIAGEKARAEKAEKDLEDAIKVINEVTIPALQDQIKNIEEVVIPALQQDIQDLKDGKVDKVDFEAYKKETAQTIKLMKDAIGDLSKLTTTNKESLVDAVNEVVAKLDDYVLKTTFEEFVKIAATKKELTDLETALDGRLDVLEALLAGDWGKDVTVKGYIDDKVTNLQNQINNIVNVLIPGLDERVTKLETTVYEQVVPQIAFAMDYEGYYTYTNGLEGYIIDSMYDAYLSAVEYTDEYMEWLVDQLNEIFDDIYNTLDLILSRVQSVVYVPDYDDQKMTMNLV